MPIKKVLITGSSGTIGTRLCEKLLKERYTVVGVDSEPNKWNERVNKLTMIGNLLERQTIEGLPCNVDLVVHLAANARVYDLVINSQKARDNLVTLFNVLEFCKKNGVKRFIFASSREIYGDQDQKQYSEKNVCIRSCGNPYAASKIGGEALVHAYHRCYGINFIVIRFSNVYGMYDESDRVIPLFIRLTRENQDLTIYGGEKILDFTYIDDAISGVLECIRSFEKVKNEVYNIASGKGVSILQVAKLIQTYMNANNRIVIRQNRIGEVMKFVADISKARKELNYEPRTGIIEGIRKSVNWYTGSLYDK